MSQPVCANCGREIHRPLEGSYPPRVEWVHQWSPLGAGNRYCNTGSGHTAQPTEQPKP